MSIAGGERLVVDVDDLRGVDRLRARLGDDDRDDVADESHAVLRERVVPGDRGATA